MQYFHPLTDPEEAKQIFRRLSMNFHPDKGGDDELFREIKTEYEEYNIIQKHLPEIIRTLQKQMQQPHQPQNELSGILDTIEGFIDKTAAITKKIRKL